MLALISSYEYGAGGVGGITCVEGRFCRCHCTVPEHDLHQALLGVYLRPFR